MSTPAYDLSPTEVEQAAELGAPEAIKARGYWDQIWKRFRRDRVAIASIVFLVLLISRLVSGRLDRRADPRSRPQRDLRGRDRRRRPAGRPRQLCRRLRDRREGAPAARRGQLARAGRVPAPALRRARVAPGRSALDHLRDADRRLPRSGRRLLPGHDRHRDLEADRDHDGVPGAPLRDRARERPRARA